MEWERVGGANKDVVNIKEQQQQQEWSTVAAAASDSNDSQADEKWAHFDAANNGYLFSKILNSSRSRTRCHWMTWRTRYQLRHAGIF